MAVLAALAEVEDAITDDRLDDAVALLGGIAAALLALPPEPEALAHATWLAGAVALRQGDQAGFERLSRDAVQGLRLAGEGERAATVHASRDELIAQLADVREVQRDGAAGLMAVLERHVATLRDIAATRGWKDPRWPTVNRRRALLPALLALVATTTGDPPPLARMLDELELDPVENVLFVALAMLTRAGAPILPTRLARMCFGEWRGHNEAVLRLRDDGRLARASVLVRTAGGELALQPYLLARLYDTAVERR